MNTTQDPVKTLETLDTQLDLETGTLLRLWALHAVQQLRDPANAIEVMRAMADNLGLPIDDYRWRRLLAILGNAE